MEIPFHIAMTVSDSDEDEFVFNLSMIGRYSSNPIELDCDEESYFLSHRHQILAMPSGYSAMASPISSAVAPNYYLPRRRRQAARSHRWVLFLLVSWRINSLLNIQHG